MNDERTASDIVTEFLHSTTRLRLQITEHDVHAVAVCASQAGIHPEKDAEAEIIPLITGSVAEFYIEPMLLIFGDVDIMLHHNYVLAIPQGHLPPAQLPAEFHNDVYVYEIVDSHFSGFVYLEERYLLTERIEYGEYMYNCTELEKRYYCRNQSAISRAGLSVNGPAIVYNMNYAALLSVDSVFCIRCLSWPPQAVDWPTRHRNYDWPDSATVDRVVNNGCDVVGVAHRQCRQDEWMSKALWRLSFSRAEIVLLNSWMPVQQIVYHMLCVFVKTEPLANNFQACMLSNYHIKTLMMWACELKSSSFWTDDPNLIRICVELLHTLSVWLTDARCQHYFVKNCNLVDNTFDSNIITSLLTSINEVWLSAWFVNNYIQKCIRLCPNYVPHLPSDISANEKLLNAVKVIANWRQNNMQRDMWHAFKFTEINILAIVYCYPLTVQSCILLDDRTSKAR